MITGKAKEDFEKWFCQQKDLKHGIDFLEDIPFSMQYGVYVDWFDSVGIVIDLYYDVYDSIFFGEVNITTNYMGHNRSDARREGIEAACEIYNEKTK